MTENTGALNVEKPFDILGNAQNCEIERKQREVQSVPNGLNALASFDQSVCEYIALTTACTKNAGSASHQP